MNQIKLKAPSGIDTTITLPSSKSICNRALIMHYLADNKGKLASISIRWFRQIIFFGKLKR